MFVFPPGKTKLKIEDFSHRFIVLFTILKLNSIPTNFVFTKQNLSTYHVVAKSFINTNKAVVSVLILLKIVRPHIESK